MNSLEKHISDERYDLLIKQISLAVADAKRRVATAINETLVEIYWNCRY